VEHRLQSRLVGQRTRRKRRQVVSAEQVRLRVGGNRIADVVDQVVEEAGDQGREDFEQVSSR
jgi:hypothetical protein